MIHEDELIRHLSSAPRPPLIVIAELGSNPEADSWRFAHWCLAARVAGATHVKVQLFRAEHFPPDERDSKRRFEFPRARLADFAGVAREHNLIPGASVFDAEAVELAAEHCDFLKLAAREQFNSDLIAMALSFDKPIYRSISSVRAIMKPASNMTTLWTIQHYPTNMARALMMAVVAAYRLRGMRWGWSSHTRGVLDCVLAARFGAQAIEKHLASSRYDIEAGHSLMPHAFAGMVKAL